MKPTAPLRSIAQSGSALLGTWRLVSYEARDSDGRVQYPLGENVSSLLVYDGGGNMGRMKDEGQTNW